MHEQLVEVSVAGRMFTAKARYLSKFMPAFLTLPQGPLAAFEVGWEAIQRLFAGEREE